MLPAIGLAVGLALGLWLHPDVPVWMQPYLPIAVIAALDALFGGLRAALDGIFDDKVFVVSFLSNVVVAAFSSASAVSCRRVSSSFSACASSRTSPPSVVTSSRHERDRHEHTC